MSENLWKNLFFQKLERMELGVQNTHGSMSERTK